jgi:hypothetical protein
MFSTGLASESTGAFFEVRIWQESQDNRDEPLTTTDCKLLLVDVPSTAKLVLGAEKTRIAEGPLLSKGLFSFVDVVKALSSKKDRLSAPFENSAFTSVLHDVLGFTSVVLGLACLAQGQAKASKETMKLLSLLKKTQHYPSQSVEFLKGNLMKYRAKLGQLLDRIEELKAESEQPRAEDEANLLRLKQLEEDLLKANLDSSTSQEDGIKCYKMLELFKAKYSKLVEDKAKQARELILSEEQKLEISKALIELKLANSEMAEKFETEK